MPVLSESKGVRPGADARVGPYETRVGVLFSRLFRRNRRSPAVVAAQIQDRQGFRSTDDACARHAASGTDNA